MPLANHQPPALELRDFTVGYAGQAIVTDVSLSVDRSAVLAVMGANGSGKTTLIRGLLGLAPVLSGQVFLQGKPLTKRRDRANIGYVPQQHTAGNSVPATVTEVVSTGRLPRLGILGRPGPMDRKIVQLAIETVQLTSQSRQELSTLSGGQQRRALIARALAAQPSVLIMDEPLAGVDQASAKALADALRILAGQGVPMIIVTHELNQLADIWTRAVVLENGKITTDDSIGSPDSTLSSQQTDHHHIPGQHDHPHPVIGQPFTDFAATDPL